MTMKPNKLTKGSNIRWESMRMMLPEHVQALLRYKEEQMKIVKPILDDQELQEIGRTLNEALHQHHQIRVKYYKDGFIESLEGYVTNFDHVMKRIKIEKDPEIWWLKIEDVTGIEPL